MSGEGKTRVRCTKCNGAQSVIMSGVWLEFSRKKESEVKQGPVNSDQPDDVTLL